MKSEIVLTDKSIDDIEVSASITVFSGGGGVRAILKPIATFPDYGAVLLVSALPGASEVSNWTGMVGTIYALRGAFDAANITAKFEVALSTAHLNMVAETSDIIGSDLILSFGVYRYKGVRFLGIADLATSAHSYIFDGIHSADCIFRVVSKDEAVKE